MTTKELHDKIQTLNYDRPEQIVAVLEMISDKLAEIEARLERLPFSTNL